MSLSSDSLKGKIITELQAKGFKTTNGFAWTDKYAEAIAKAVVDEITSNAKATTVIAGGSSAGTYEGTVK